MTQSSLIRFIDSKGRLTLPKWKNENVRIIESENEITIRRVHIADALSAKSEAMLQLGIQAAKKGKFSEWEKGDLSFLDDADE